MVGDKSGCRQKRIDASAKRLTRQEWIVIMGIDKIGPKQGRIDARVEREAVRNVSDNAQCFLLPSVCCRIMRSDCPPLAVEYNSHDLLGDETARNISHMRHFNVLWGTSI